MATDTSKAIKKKFKASPADLARMSKDLQKLVYDKPNDAGVKTKKTTKSAAKKKGK